MPWHAVVTIQNRQYCCGHCGSEVASSLGYFNNDNVKRIYICPRCDMPSMFHHDVQIPSESYGSAVAHLPENVAHLYNEARDCISVGASTSSVLALRKLLMNLAVANGAKEGESFIKYVEFLSAAGFIPPNGKAWVDHIRQKGNEATHEIKLMSLDDAKELIDFAEMLLTFIYEFPARIRKT